jgi:hypothetical protein
MNQKWKWTVWGVAAVLVIGALFGTRIPQPQSYHQFADQRNFLAIPHFFDVVSNLGFLVVGLWGIRFVLLANTGAGTAFLTSKERWPYFFFFSWRAVDRVWLRLLSLGPRQREVAVGSSADGHGLHGTAGSGPERARSSGSRESDVGPAGRRGNWERPVLAMDRPGRARRSPLVRDRAVWFPGASVGFVPAFTLSLHGGKRHVRGGSAVRSCETVRGA